MSKRQKFEARKVGDSAVESGTNVGLEELLAQAERREEVLERWLSNATPSDVALDHALSTHRELLRELYVAIGAHIVRAAREGRTHELLRAVNPDEVVARGRASRNELEETLPPEFSIDGLFDTLRPDGHHFSAPINAAKLEDTVAEGPREAAARDNLSDKTDVTHQTSERLRSGLSPRIAALAEQRRIRQRDQLVDLSLWYERMGPTPAALESENALTELEHIEGFVEEAVDQWGLLDKVRNFQLTAWLTKRLRAVQAVFQQDEATPEAYIERLDIAFSTVSVHSRTTRPGFVFGLALGHDPECGTWLRDAMEREGNIRRELGLEGPAGTAADSTLPS